MISLKKYATKKLEKGDRNALEQKMLRTVQPKDIVVMNSSDSKRAARRYAAAFLGTKLGLLGGPLPAIALGAAGYGAGNVINHFDTPELHRVENLYGDEVRGIPLRYRGDYKEALERLGYKPLKSYGETVSPLLSKILLTVLGGGLGALGSGLLGYNALDLDSNESALLAVLGGLAGGTGGYFAGNYLSKNLPVVTDIGVWRKQ